MLFRSVSVSMFLFLLKAEFRKKKVKSVFAIFMLLKFDLIMKFCVCEKTGIYLHYRQFDIVCASCLNIFTGH